MFIVSVIVRSYPIIPFLNTDSGSDEPRGFSADIRGEDFNRSCSSSAVQHERAPRSTSSLVAAARRTPSGLYAGIPNVYHATGTAYHPLLYPALFPFKPTVPAFTPSVGKSTEDSLDPGIPSAMKRIAVLAWLAHFLPRPTPESLSMTAAKEDEVTSSEEAATIDVRVEKGTK